MKKILLLLALFLPFLWSCGNGSSMNNQYPMDGGSDIIDTPQDTTLEEPGSTEVPVLPDAPKSPDSNMSNALNISTASAAVSGFCDSQKQLQILSTSLMSAYSPKGNGPDIYYCGGTAHFTEDGALFDIELTDYCVNARGHQVMLNGMIHGKTDSGEGYKRVEEPAC